MPGRLNDVEFDTVLCSPLQRARETCELAGLGDRMQLEDGLLEWDYGDYDGLTTTQIREERPTGTSGATAAQAARRRSRWRPALIP